MCKLNFTIIFDENKDSYKYQTDYTETLLSSATYTISYTIKYNAVFWSLRYLHINLSANNLRGVNAFDLKLYRILALLKF